MFPLRTSVKCICRSLFGRPRIQVVVFDVGETLVNESRQWRQWAAYLGVSEQDFLTALDEAIAGGEHHARVFERFRPGFDLDAARRERAARGDADTLTSGDLYPDAAPCLRALRQRGIRVGVAANQPADQTEHVLKLLGVEADFVGGSADWGVEKPAPEFFARIADLAAAPPSRIAYVGDRLDNDVLPARAAGMCGVFLERGPWGRVHARRPELAFADIRISSLAALPAALAKYNKA